MARPYKRRQDIGQLSASVGVETRDPVVTTRDPVPQQRKPRRYIRAGMPTVCPECGHGTRMDDGRHVDVVAKRILEYRSCAWCEKKLVAVRQMTLDEEKKLCTHEDGVAEYEFEKRSMA